jgi:hypothetical protein
MAALVPVAAMCNRRPNATARREVRLLSRVAEGHGPMTPGSRSIPRCQLSGKMRVIFPDERVAVTPTLVWGHFGLR